MNSSPLYLTDARQLEIHLYNPQHDLVQWLKSKGIVPQAYSPLGSTNSPLLSDETASGIASAHGLQISDVLLGYLGKLQCVHVAPTGDRLTTEPQWRRR